MRPRSVAILAIRIIALVFGVEAVTAIIQLIIFTAQAREAGGTGSFWATLIFRLIVALALWRFAEDISKPMSRGTDDEPPLVARRTVNVAAVAFSVVGVILISQATIDFIGAIVTSSRIGPTSSLTGFPLIGPGYFSGLAASIIVEVVRFAIGLLLVLHSGNLARYLSLRYPESEPPAAPPSGDTPPAL